MATFQLSLPDSMSTDPSVVTGPVNLENVRYSFTLRWSPRDDVSGMWRMDISDAAGKMRVAGIPLLVSENVLEPFQYPGRGIPPGHLRVTRDPDPLTGVRTDPGLYDFGQHARIEYVESTSVVVPVDAAN